MSTHGRARPPGAPLQLSGRLGDPFLPMCQL